MTEVTAQFREIRLRKCRLKRDLDHIAKTGLALIGGQCLAGQQMV